MDKLLKVLFALIFILTAGSLFSYEATGYGLKLDQRPEQYLSVGVNLPFYSKTFKIGKFPEENSIRELNHKKYDKYWQLTNNEKIVYDTVLTRAWDIYDFLEDDLNMRVPVKNFEYYKEGSNINDDMAELKSAISNLDFKKVFNALHEDYDWIFWYEFNMDWTINSPDLEIEDGVVKGSFLIEAKGYDEYFQDSRLTPIVKTRLSSAQKAAQKIISSNKNNVRNYAEKVVKYAEYNKEVAEEIMNNGYSDDYLVSKSILSVFNNESPVVCRGYSNALQMLCDISDVEIYSQEGLLLTGDKSSDHSWNIMYEGDDKFLFDLTNSEQGTAGADGFLIKARIEGRDYSVFDIRYVEK